MSNAIIKNLLIRGLENLLNKLKTDKCEVTEEEAMEIIQTIANEPLSKSQACNYLNISRSKFDNLIKQGKLPKGIKRKGFKELVWRKQDLKI